MSLKRILENEEADGEAAASQEEKRPRIPGLRNVITEALMMNNWERIIVPVIRRVVSEEIDRALAKHIPAKLRSPPKQIQGSESINLRLRFLNKLALPLFTGSRIEGDQNSSIQIALLDSSTGERITSGPESLQKVDIVVLEGDFGHDDDEEWTAEEFESYVVREREGKRPLLAGELVVSLKEGVGTFGELSFTDNSSWIRSRKFRLGARVQGSNHGGIRIREAKTDAFTVKDHRGELYKKHYPPALDDDVWRLDKVGKDGAFHKRLSEQGINTVQEFLRVLNIDPQRLRNILGSGMSNKMWDGTVEHAKTCVLNRKCYVYNADRQNNISVIFNVIYEPKSVVIEGRFLPMGELSEAQKPFVERLVKSAYEHWNEMIELEEEFLIGNPSYSLTLQPHIEVPGGHGDPNYQRTVLVSQQDGQGPQIDLKSQVMGSRFMGHQQSMKVVNADWLQPEDSVNMVAPNQVAMVTGFMQQGITPPIVSPSLALGPRQAHVNPPNMAYQTTNLNSHTYRNGLRNQYEGPDGFYHSNSSNDLVSNLVSRGSDGDLQNWFINGATAEQEYNFFPSTQGDQVFTFTGFPSTANLSFGDRLHGKAYVGWLKIKAALKWGISVRKVAAARRAKLEELED